MHPFVEFADDMRRLHDRLELALRIGPQWSEVPCYCGGRLERPMPLPDGRAYEWRCVRCHRNYDEDQYWLAARESGQAV